MDEPLRRDDPIPTLIRALVADASLLLRRELELATIEVKASAKEAGVGAGLIAGGAVVAAYGLAVLIAAAVLALSLVLPAWASALIVGLVLVAVAIVVVAIGRARLRAATPIAPTATVEGAKEDVAWIRQRMTHLKTHG